MDNVDLREQLRRLGVSQGAYRISKPARHEQPIGRQPHRGRDPEQRHLEELLPGEVVHTPYGPFFLTRESYDCDYRHGSYALADLLAHPLEVPARLARDTRLAEVDPRRIAFVDTETTGLAGGTGTYAFLVGVGVFEEKRFVVHQFFMRDYSEEPAQLHALGQLLDGIEAVVSFNGRSFDLPLLETRFIMARQPPRLTDLPHLDLLPVARRLWGYRLDSCALASLEDKVLGVRRTQDDVPGWLIPGIYMDYARSGDAREMPRIFYHNAQDILSMVALAARQCDLVSVPLEPGAAKGSDTLSDLPGEDLYGVGRFFQELGHLDRAELAFTQAAQACRSPQVREMTMRDLAFLLKRQGRREEALGWWQALAETSDAVYACEELAKHYEWHEQDLLLALTWTRRALALAEQWPPGPKRRETLADLGHRLWRLGRKGGNSGGS